MGRTPPAAKDRIDRATVERRGLLTVDEAADFLALHPSTAYRMAKDGRIPTVRIGGCVRVPAIAALAIANGETVPQFRGAADGTGRS